AQTRNVIRLPLARGAETIFLVEDDPALRKLARGVLEEYGYDVVEAASGVEALGVWKEHRNEIDLLLTDIVLPHGLSGWKLAQQLQTERADLKVIYSTGFDLESLNRRFDSQKNLVLLRKPYQVQSLVRTVRDCLDS